MRPLGMTSTVYDLRVRRAERRAFGYRWENDALCSRAGHGDGAFGAMGGVETSANDYARWVAFLLSAWPARDGPETGPVRRASVRELAQGLNFVRAGQRPARRAGKPARTRPPTGWACASHRIATSASPSPRRRLSGLRLLSDAAARHGVGVFAFANRTYAGAGPPVCRRRSSCTAPACCRRAPRRSATRWPRPISGRRGLSRRHVEPGRGRAGDELPDGPLGRELGARARASCRPRPEPASTGADHADRRDLGQLLLALRARPARAATCCSRRPTRRRSRSSRFASRRPNDLGGHHPDPLSGDVSRSAWP